MASLPPQRAASQRRAASPSFDSSQPDRTTTRTNSFSAASVDSQTVLLNSRMTNSSELMEQHLQKELSAQTPSQPPPPPQSDIEPRKCWICFNDETEDDETTSEWRSPCPCVLVAHERCLLDWIADMEAPNARRRAGRDTGKILCPQCKSEIKLRRPKSLGVELVRAIEKFTGMMFIPGFLFVTGTAAYTTLRLSGVHTIYEIFGPEDGLQILAPLYQAPVARESSGVLRLFSHLRDHWRLDIGLPVIPTVLIASRTYLADSFLPLLPLLFFASSDAGDELLQLSWPPSAAFTVAALPYVRGIYNAYYDRVWAPRERRWLKEIQPRAGTDEDLNREDQHPHHNHAENILDALAEEDNFDMDEEGNDVLEVELEIGDVDFDIFAGWNGGGAEDNNQAPENPPVPIAQGPAAPPQDDDEPPPLVGEEALHAPAAPAPDVPLQPAAPAQPRRQRARRGGNNGFSASVSLADAILGALVFPTIAAAVGEALKFALPKSWVTPPVVGKPTGFLQAKWGRSILGGCLFVGFKDAVYLYVRWKMAQNHRRRSVLDYDKSKGKKKAGKA